jgi:hypothetical protein
MAYLLDIIMAMLIGSVLILGIISANQLIYQHSTIMNGDVLVQQMLISNAQIVEGEFRNMGYCVAEDSTTVLAARDTAITFLSDINRDSVPDRIEYWLGAANEHRVQNTKIRLLHRRVNGGATQSVGAVTNFRIKYYSQNQVDTLLPPVAAADLDMIKIVELTMEVQNPYALYKDPRDVNPGEPNAFYSSSYWRQTRLASQNLKR